MGIGTSTAENTRLTYKTPGGYSITYDTSSKNYTFTDKAGASTTINSADINKSSVSVPLGKMPFSFTLNANCIASYDNFGLSQIQNL